MLGKDFKELLKDLPDDCNIELGKFIALDLDKPDEQKDAYEVRLDYPIIGVAMDEKSNDAVFVVGAGKETLPWLLKFSEDIKKI